ncbi:ATP synthase epsilon chain [Thermodesulfobium narugense DSM 14796]|uniref:ATP synthase epsilon chain n=1 Tax=Thermodesulfobium narugense DSM 14796 TaxID=747365 RepID=M1E5F5_9BACT|nr:ATP synthase F1 subunit epsilon [Thermodesulfobium narugense]AEE14236.1 ATP synthase epsilon chain [Thermodesulfobium narugense DSM 14796]
MKLLILTPEGVVVDEEVTFVSAMGEEGSLGIMPRHAPLVTTLKVDVIEFVKENSDREVVAAIGGILEVKDNKVTVLSDAAELAVDIDELRAKEAEKRARARLTMKTEEVDVKRAEAALARALARLKAIELLNRRSGSRKRGA